jgi:uncharacterized Zn finger protein
MDNGQGKFEMLNKPTQEKINKMEADNPDHGGWFRVGEVVELKGSRFRVKSIKPTELRLKLLPKEV